MKWQRYDVALTWKRRCVKGILSLKILSNEHVTNADFCRKILAAIVEDTKFLIIFKKRKPRYFGHRLKKGHSMGNSERQMKR